MEERDFEQQKVTEVEEAFVQLQETCLQGDQAPRLGPLAGEDFDLFCADHVDHCYNADFPASKRVDFYVLDEDGEHLEDQSSCDNSGRMNGHVFFDASNGLLHSRRH